MVLSLVRVASVIAVVVLAPPADAYSAKDMHELLWYMFRQHPNGVEAIYGDHYKVLLPPQENHLVIPEIFTTGDYIVVVPVLWRNQWFAAIARFKRENGLIKRHVTFYQTIRPSPDHPIKRFGTFEAEVRNTRKVDAAGSASGPIIAQFILRLFRLADSYGTAEHMRFRHMSFLQRRRELMTARRNIRELDNDKNESDSGVDLPIQPFRAAALLASIG